MLKGARVALDLEQEELAKLAGLSRPTVSAFENSKVRTYERTRAAIQAALETRGIVFTNGDRPGFYIDKQNMLRPPGLQSAREADVEPAERLPSASDGSSNESKGQPGTI